MNVSVILLGLSSPSQTLLCIQIIWESYECRFWFSRWVKPGVGPKMHITNQFPSEATTTDLWMFWVSQGIGTVFTKDWLIYDLVWSSPNPCEVTIVISTLEMRTLRVWLEMASIFKCQVFLEIRCGHLLYYSYNFIFYRKISASNVDEKREKSGMLLLLLSHFSHVWLGVTPWTAAHQAPPSLGFSR